MTLLLDAVCDLDCVVSASPLVLDLPKIETYARGKHAIARRVVYAWCSDAGLLELEGASWDEPARVAYRSQLAALAEEEDYVAGADVDVEIDDSGETRITCALLFVDGSTYPLEMTAADAVSVVFP